MSIRFQPTFGQILICDFPVEFEAPEMVKRRPVVCISPKVRSRFGLVSVVPLSTTPPDKIEPFDIKVRLQSPISQKFSSLECWAKCDMIYTFSFTRLTCPYTKNGFDRIYKTIVLPPGTMCEILTGVMAGMGVEGSVQYEQSTYRVLDFKDFLG